MTEKYSSSGLRICETATKSETATNSCLQKMWSALALFACLSTAAGGGQPHVLGDEPQTIALTPSGNHVGKGRTLLQRGGETGKGATQSRDLDAPDAVREAGDQATVATAVVTSTPAWYFAERAALEDLYHATGGPGWKNSSGWKTEPCHCEWAGIACSGEGGGHDARHDAHDDASTRRPSPGCVIQRVSVIDLHSNDLHGTLPGWNGTDGSLASLQQLWLNDNGLAGLLPSSYSAALTSLRYLTLSENELAGPLPPTWAALTGLKRLYLFSNKLGGSLPPEWASLKNSLQILDLHHNRIVGSLPPSWSVMSFLSQLWLNDNMLTGSLPPSWAALGEGLHQLQLENNQLSGILPPQWGALTNLQWLHLHQNSLLGTLPSEWTRMQKLYSLWLNENLISGTLPDSYAGLSSAGISTIRLNENRLSGSLPASWAALGETLLELWLNDNYFTGTMPPQWSALTMLNELNLGANSLSGTLPATWGGSTSMLESLSLLFIPNNRLEGSIPPSWFAGTSGSSIKVFDARHNHFSGSLPKLLLDGPALCISLLSDNQFSGSIEVLGQNFFKPFCDIALDDVNTPFRPALLLQNNRFSCDLPRGYQPNTVGTSADALQSCLSPNYSDSWQDQCRRLFENSSTPVRNPALVLAGNLFDGPLPRDWGSLHDPMWSDAPFLLFNRGEWLANTLFTLLVGYLGAGAVLLVAAYAMLPGQRDYGGGGADAVARTMDCSLALVYKLGLRWLSAVTVLLLAVHVPLYVSAARYLTCGNPLLRTTSAYLADSPAQTLVVAICGLVLAVFSAAFLAQLYRIMADERTQADVQFDEDGEVSDGEVSAGNDDAEPIGRSRWLARLGWAMAWLGAATVLSIPTALYATATTIPIGGLGVLYVIIHYGAPVYLTLINTLAVPWVSRVSSRRSGLPTSWLLLVSRLLSTWAVPALVVVVLDNSCGQYWVKFWSACSTPENIRAMNVQGPNGGFSERTSNDHEQSNIFATNISLVDARKEICLQRDSALPLSDLRINPPQCARAVIAALAPLLIKKMAIASLILPGITVLKWRIMPRGLRSRLCCDDTKPLQIDISVDNAMAQVMTWLDVAIIFGPQVPLLLPLVMMAVVGQRWAIHVGLARLGRQQVRWSKSQSAIWSVAMSVFVQQGLNIWLYQEMSFDNSSVARIVRVLTWASALTAFGGVVLARAWQKGQLSAFIRRVQGAVRRTRSETRRHSAEGDQSKRTPFLDGRETSGEAQPGIIQ